MTAHKPIEISTIPQPYRFSRKDYVLLSERGAFSDVAKTELIDGVILAVNAQYSRHVRAQTMLLRLLADACDCLDNGMGAWIDGSLSIDNGSMPQPDIFVSRGLPDEGPVTLDRIALAVEVSDTTLKFDLDTKAKLYAAAGIAEYWVADVIARRLHQMWNPVDGSYVSQREIAFGSPIAAATVAGLGIETTTL